MRSAFFGLDPGFISFAKGVSSSVDNPGAWQGQSCLVLEGAAAEPVSELSGVDSPSYGLFRQRARGGMPDRLRMPGMISALWILPGCSVSVIDNMWGDIRPSGHRLDTSMEEARYRSSDAQIGYLSDPSWRQA